MTLLAYAVGYDVGWAETATLTQSKLGLTGSYTSSTEKTIDGITYVYTDLQKNSNNIQAKASSGVIYNKTAYPGNITSVEITHSGTARPTTIHGSSDGTNWTEVSTGSGSITADFRSKNYKYFKITRGSNAAYWTQIVITYETGSSPGTVATPTFSPAAGTVPSGTEVTLSTTTSGASIYYTTDGTEPSTSSFPYSSPIAITSDMTIKAIAVKDGISSTVAEAAYTITPADNSNKYQLVTSTSQMESGKKYLIVSVGSYNANQLSYNYKVAATGITGTFIGGEDITIASDNTITLSSSSDVVPYIMTLSEGKWSFTNSKTNDNLTFTDPTSSGGTVGTGTTGTGFTLNSINSSTGAAELSLTNSKLYFNPNSAAGDASKYRFTTYKSPQKSIMLFKQVAEEEKAYTIDYAEVTGGSATGPEGADANETVIVTLSANSGYAPNGITVTGVDANDITDNGDGTYTFTMPAQNVTVTPLFVPTYTITCEAAEGGTLAFTVNSVAGNKAAAGDNVTVTATAATGYELATLTVDGSDVTSSVSNDKYTFNMPDHDVAVSATFTQVDYTIDKASVEAGSVSVTVGGNEASTAHYGDQVTLAYTPDDGYVLQGWTVTHANGTVDVDNNTFSMPASNVTVTANVIAPKEITRTISTNGTAGNTAGGWLGNWAVKSGTTGYVHDDYQAGTSGATNYSVVAGVGTQVQFQAGTNNGYEIVPANISITSGGNPVSFTTEPASQGGGYIVTFTMPAAPVAISANFTTYISDLYILGTANENDWAGNVGVAMTKPASVSGNYSARVYFKGANGYFSFATALGSDASTYPADANRFNPESNNYDLAGNNYTAAISSDNASSNSLMLPAGIYDITVNVDKTQVTVAPVTITAPTLSVAAGDVDQNSSVSVTAGNLSALLADIVSGKSATTELSTDGTTYTAGSSYTFATPGNVTVSARDSYGSIHSPVASAAYTVRKMTTPITLFHETFGSNSGSARNWSDDYSVKSGVAAVYSGITGYNVTNAKQTKNTMGFVGSGLHNPQSDQVFQTASIVMGPLNVADYESLKLAYQWKPASVSKEYWAKAYYATSSDGGFAELTTSSTGSVTANDFTERLYSLPESAEVSTLYIKVEWYTSNSNGIIDEVDLQGVLKEVAPKAYTIDYAEATGGSASGPEGADADETVTVTVTPDTGFACTGISVTTDDENYPTLTATGSGNSYSFDVPVLAAGSTITVTPSFETAYALTYVNKYIDINGVEQTGDNGGTVTGPARAVYNAAVDVTVTAESDYKLTELVYSWNNGGSSNSIYGTGEGPFNFRMPGYATTVTATFAKIPHTFTVESANGSVSGLPENAVSGTSVTFRVNPNPGYVVSSVSGTFNNGSGIGTLNITDNGDGTYTFNMVAYDVTITVTYFASEDYVLLTNVADIQPGETYLLVGTSQNTVMGPKGNETYASSISVTPVDGVISSTAEMAIVNFLVQGEGNNKTYAIHTAEGYLTNSGSSKALGVSNTAEGNYVTITLDANSVATIQRVSTSGNRYLNYNTSSPRWAFYSGTGTGSTYIYKRSTGVATPVIAGIPAVDQNLGTYNFIGRDTVTITCTTEGAALQYSLDGGTTWTAYTEPFEITAVAAGNTVEVTARASATVEGESTSKTATATFTCIKPRKPYFGTNWDGESDVTSYNPMFIYPKRPLKANIIGYEDTKAYGEAASEFYYSTDGNAPTIDAAHKVTMKNSSGEFIFLDEIAELQVVKVINGIASDPASGIIDFEVAAPAISLAGGTYDGDQTTRLTTETKTNQNNVSWTTKMYYTTGSTDFAMDATTGEVTSSEWQEYDVNTPISILVENSPVTLKAITVANYYGGAYNGSTVNLGNSGGKWKKSDVTTATYTLTVANLDVIFSPAGGNYLYAKDVALTPVNAVGNVTIHYSTSGTADASSDVYTGPIHVAAGTTTISVYAVDSRESGNPTVENGGVYTKAHTYNIGVQEPLFSPYPGEYPGAGDYYVVPGNESTAVNVEIFDVSPGAEIHYTVSKNTLGDSMTQPATPTKASDKYTGTPITLEPGNTYVFSAIAYVGNQASTVRTRAFTVRTNTESGNFWYSIKEMNEETDNTTTKTLANPVEVIYMNTYQNDGKTPEFAFVRDNSGYGYIYFGNNATDKRGYTIYKQGDWIKGMTIKGKAEPWSSSFINEVLVSSTQSEWNAGYLDNRTLIPETTTCKDIRDGWGYPDGTFSGQATTATHSGWSDGNYADYVTDKNIFGHYVHLRKNTITGTGSIRTSPAKRSGTITGELGIPLCYYDGLYLHSGYKPVWNDDNLTITYDESNDLYQSKFDDVQNRGGTFDVYAIVYFFGPYSNNSKWNNAPFEVFPIAFDHIFPPIFNLAGDGTAADMTIDNPKRTRYEATTLTLSCETRGAVIMYKTSDMEDFAVYNGEIINVDKTMTIETYSLHSTEHFDQLESKVRTLTINMGSVEQPVISPESVMRAIGGDPVNATISCATEGATIWYTTDGSDPRDDTNAGRYEYNAGGSNPALTGISSTTTVRAIAEADGFYSVEAEPKTYTFVKSNGIVYDLVTSEADLKEGAIYVIVSKEYNMAMQRSQKENNRDQSPVLFLQEGDAGYVAEKTKVYGNDDLAIFTLHKFAGTGPNWTLHTSNGVNNASIGYLYGQASGSTNQLKTEFTLDSEGKTEAYIEVDSDGTAHISFVKPDEPRYLRYNHSFNLFNSYTNESTGDPVYLYKKDAFPLANIEKKGVKNQQYTVADELIGVYAKGNKLWAKDQAVSIDANDKPEGYSDFLLEEAFIGEAKNELSGKNINVPNRYLQNNWVVLIMPEGTDAADYVDAYIPAASVIGELTDDVNYTITLKQAPGAPINMSPDELYVKNVYAPTSFVSTYWGENDDNIYFVKPKVQEVANIAWAVWNGTSFEMPENCPAGSFAISDFSLNSDSNPKLETGKAYAFMAVMENGGSSLSGIRRLKSGDSPATFNIKPLNLTSTSPVTGINTVGGSVKEVQSVRVYNVAGVEQRELQPGVNIVVTTYTDGTRSTAKVLR